MILSCLITKFAWKPSNWEAKDKFILPINNERISEANGRELKLVIALTTKNSHNQLIFHYTFSLKT